MKDVPGNVTETSNPLGLANRSRSFTAMPRIAPAAGLSCCPLPLMTSPSTSYDNPTRPSPRANTPAASLTAASSYW